MIRISILSATAIIYLYGLGRATVINIPADYATIQQGIDASTDGDTVLVQPGTYVENIEFNGHNIVLGSLFLTTGDTSYISSTILDAGSSGSVVRFESGEGNGAMVVGLTLQHGSGDKGGGVYCAGSDPTILSNNIYANHVFGFGGGIYCESNSSLIIAGNKIANNHADWGGAGLYIGSSHPLLMRNVILSNDCFTFGGAVLCNLDATPEITNNTFSRNSAYYGGAICYINQSSPIITNSIFWADSSYGSDDEIFGDGTSFATFAYCDVRNILLPGAGNISVDPLFRDPDNGDFHLMAIACGDSLDSPCIDAGDPNILDSLLDCSWGLGGLRSDMGAYGGGELATVGIFNNSSYLPKEFMLLQNYPNPFNSGTTIRFIIVESMEVRLAVYDILGREVRDLIDHYKQAGIYTVNFDATGLASGVYFCRLQAGGVVDTKPMVLLR